MSEGALQPVWPSGEPTRTIDFTSGQERARRWCSWPSGCDSPEEYGQGVCSSHGARLPTLTTEHMYQAQARTQHSRDLIVSAAPAASATMINIMTDDQASKPETRLRAAEQILDRAGVRGGTEISLQGDVRVSPAEEIRSRLETIASRLAPRPLDPAEDDGILDADVVTDEPAPEDPTAAAAPAPPRSPW